MKSISIESISLLRAIENGEVWPWSSAKAIIFEELYNIINGITEELDSFEIGSWKVNHLSNDQDKGNLSYEFNLVSGNQNIKLQIDPLNKSFLELELAESPCQQSLKVYHEFFKSPAYKRYFFEHSTPGKSLKTTFSKNQIRSRHFGAYLKHMMNMIKPMLCAGRTEKLASAA